MTTVAVARQEWQEGHRRFENVVREDGRADVLHDQRDAVLEELRRRIGTTFSLAELVAVYDGSERWLRDVIEERAPSPGWVRTASLVGDAAFHLYSRQAQDYVP